MTVDDTDSGTGAHPAPDGEPGRTAGSVTDPAPARVDTHDADDTSGAQGPHGANGRGDAGARVDTNGDTTGGTAGEKTGGTTSGTAGGKTGGTTGETTGWMDGRSRLDAQNRMDEQFADSGEDPLALRLETLILGAERRYTPFQAARSAGVSMELASRFWRAMGFADIGQAKALTEADVLALRRLAGLVEAGLLSEAMAVQVARSTGQTTARLAEWQIDSFLEGLTEPPNRA